MIKRFATAFLPVLAGLALVFSIPAPAGAAVVHKATALAPSAGDVEIQSYGWNAPGTDTNSNRNAEFIQFRNMTGADLDVEGWTVHDSYQTAGGDWGNRYTLKASALPAGSPFKKDADGDGPNAARFVMPAGSQVIVYTGSGVDSTPTSTTAALYRNFKHYLNNAGDTIYVQDGTEGLVVAKIEYNSYRVKITQ